MKLKEMETDFLGKTIKHYHAIDSTQTQIWRLVKSHNIINGTVVIADIQTAGKGTHGRVWHTDETGNVAFSMYIETNCNIEQIEGITLEIAEVIVNIFKEKYNIELEIKPPNDIVYNNKKIGGILTECQTICKNVKNLVIGIGINLIQENFSEDIENIATSIKKEFGIKIDNLELIMQFCNKFEKIIRLSKIYSLAFSSKEL